MTPLTPTVTRLAPPVLLIPLVSIPFSTSHLVSRIATINDAYSTLTDLFASSTPSDGLVSYLTLSLTLA